MVLQLFHGGRGVPGFVDLSAWCGNVNQRFKARTHHAFIFHKQNIHETGSPRRFIRRQHKTFVVQRQPNIWWEAYPTEILANYDECGNDVDPREADSGAQASTYVQVSPRLFTFAEITQLASTLSRPRMGVVAIATVLLSLTAMSATSPPSSFSTAESVVEVPVTVRFSALQDLANQKAPRSVSGEVDNPTRALTEDKLRWTVNRGDITIARGDNCIAVSVPLNGHATARGRVGFRRRGPFGFLGHFLSAPVQETANFRGTAHGCVSFEVGADWTLKPNVALSLDIDKAEVRLLNAIPVSFRSLAQEAFEREKDTVLRDITTEMMKAVDAKTRVAKAWNQLHTVYQVSADPEVYARVVPTRVLWEPLAFTDSEVRFGVGLSAKVQTFVGVKPTAPTPAALPSLEASILTGATELLVPVVLNVDAIDRELGKRLAAQPLTLDKDRSLVITKAQLSDREGNALLRLTYEIQRPWYLFDLSGEVEISARPVLDASTQTLSFSNLSYTLESRSELLNVAAWLLEPAVLAVIKDRAQLALAPHLEQARQSANLQAKLMADKVGGDSQLSLDRLAIHGVSIGRGIIIAVVAGDFTTQVDLASLR